MNKINFDRIKETHPVYISELLLGISETPEWITFDQLQKRMNADWSELLMKLNELQEEGHITCDNDIYFPSAANQVKERLTSELKSIFSINL